MFDVISLGAATLDVFLKSPGMEIEGSGADKDICFRYGAKLEVDEIHFESGGGGTNSVVTFARQGLKAACVVQVGDDFAGRRIIADLENERITTDLVDVQKEGYTDYSTILWASDGGRTILVYRGKTKLEVENVLWDKLETSWFYVSSLEGNLEIIEKILRDKDIKILSKIAWNPGKRELQQREKLLELLPRITLLNVNKEEMVELLGLGDVRGMGEILSKAQELPCEYVVITDDKRGAYLWNKAEGVWWHCGIFENAPRVETTGAGDSFGSGLVSGLIRGESLADCLYLASANASSVVGAVGAKKGILKKEDLNNWSKEELKIEKVSF